MSRPAESHKDQVRRFYHSLWNQHDLSAIPLLLTGDCRFRGSLGDEKRGHEGIAVYIDMVHAALGGYQCRIDNLVAEDAQVFARMFFSGVHREEFMGYPATGKMVGWSGAALFTFHAQLIDEVWVLGDVHRLREQLADSSATFNH